MERDHCSQQYKRTGKEERRSRASKCKDVSCGQWTYYPPTFASSNAPRVHRDAFCASVRPRMPVILTRS